MKRTDAVVPVRNEMHTIGSIVAILHDFAAIDNIIFVIDKDSTDDSKEILEDFKHEFDWEERIAICGPAYRGKGQNVAHGISHVTSERVLLLDSDVAGLNYSHISTLLDGSDMTIGVLDMPAYPLPIGVVMNWPLVSGCRCLPTALVKNLDLQGYLMETQINQAAAGNKIPIHAVPLYGATNGSWHWPLTDLRKAEMERDRKIGQELGILPEGKRRKP